MFSYVGDRLLKKRSSISFEWTILGASSSGDDILLLKSRIKSLNLDTNISVVSDATEHEKDNYFLMSDLYIQPSWHEGFGNAILEAMSFGLPALVSRYTAQPEVVGSTGIIVHKLSGQIIYENLLDFINLDLKTREKNIDNLSKRISQNFSYEVRLKNYQNILDFDNE